MSEHTVCQLAYDKVIADYRGWPIESGLWMIASSNVKT